MLAVGVGVATGVAAVGVAAADSLFASVFVSVLVSVFPSGLASEAGTSDFASAAGFLPSRKSVTYQPLPLS